MEGSVLDRDFPAKVGYSRGGQVDSIEFERDASASAVLRGSLGATVPKNGLFAVVRSEFHAENHRGHVSLPDQFAPRYRHYERRYHALHQSRYGFVAFLCIPEIPTIFCRLHLPESASNPAGTAGSVEKRVHSAGVSTHGVVSQQNSADWKPGICIVVP